MNKILLLASFLSIGLIASDVSAHNPCFEDQNLPVLGEQTVFDLELDLTDNLDDEEIAKLGREYGLVISPSSPLSHEDGNLEVANISSNEDRSSVIQRLLKDKRVEAAEPYMEAHALWTPNDPMLKDQWGMEKVKAPAAWERSCGQGAVIAVVDTGVDCNVSDLKGTTCLEGYNFINPGSPPLDKNRHGTHVAGTSAQTTNNDHGASGLSYCAKILPVKVLSDSGSGSMIGVADGIMYAANHGAQVINLSLGASQTSVVVANAVKHAYDKGVFVAAAAGNSGRPMSGSPAMDFGAFTVSASDRNDALAHFSSYSSSSKQVSIAAPGVDILQQVPGGEFQKLSGTSMATPHVSGVVGMIYSMGITEPNAVMRTLAHSAMTKDDPSKFGAGILDAGAATKTAYWTHLIPRLAFLALFLFGIPFLIHREGKRPDQHWIMYPAAVLTSVGLFCFLPLTGLLPHMGDFRMIGEVLSRPLGEAYLPFSVGYHKYLPLANALLPFGLIVLGYHNRLLRVFTGGFAIGMAALLCQMFYSNDITFALGGSVGLRVWCAINAVLCLWCAKKVLIKDQNSQ